jgi:hypothetical protein
MDWRDYPTIDWMIFQNVSKLTTLNFNGYFDTNAFYPYKNSLLFSDLLLPQAIIETPFYLLTHNVILSFNIVFFITFILNYFATFLFWRQIFKKNFLAFFGSLFTIFSPFTHLEISHFPMLSFWPFFFSLYFILKSRTNTERRNLVFAGIFLAIQFLAAAYLSFFLMLIIILFYSIEILRTKDKRIHLIRNLSIILIVFVLLDGYFIKNFIDTKKLYNISHELKENVTYSAHLSDYLFTSHIDSILHQSLLAEKWNNFNKNTMGGQASFPGLLLFTLFIFSLFEVKKIQNKLVFKLDINNEQLFFLILLIVGFLSSLGPRINFNGAYAYIPTPYNLILKIVPLVQEEVRAPSRWYFLFIIAVVYFALQTIKRLQMKINIRLLSAILLLLFFLEYLPTNITTHSEKYIDSNQFTLKNLCLPKKLVLLEIPVTHLNAYPDIITGLNYISKVQLASTYHQCYLVNGYSSYDMPHLYALSNVLYRAIIDNNSDIFMKELKKSKADVVKFNTEQFPREVLKEFPSFLQKFENEKNIKQIGDQMYRIQ